MKGDNPKLSLTGIHHSNGRLAFVFKGSDYLRLQALNEENISYIAYNVNLITCVTLTR